MKTQFLTGLVCAVFGLYLGGLSAATPAPQTPPTAASRTTWEFKTEQISIGNLSTTLTYLGESGWEVMSVTGVRWESVQSGTMDAVEFVITAKRQKQN